MGLVQKQVQQQDLAALERQRRRKAEAAYLVAMQLRRHLPEVVCSETQTRTTHSASQLASVRRVLTLRIYEIYLP